MKISIITINYQDGRGLQKTLASVKDQSYQHIEHIVIDGGSTDNSVSLIQAHENDIYYWISEPDKGIYNAMNKGIQKATGNYLLFLNSGDEFSNPEALTQLAQEPLSADLIYGDLWIADQQGEHQLLFPDKIGFSFFRLYSLPHPATLIKRSCFDLVGLYDEELKIVSDWKFFLLAVCKYNCSYQHKHVLVSRFYDGGISSHPQTAAKVRAERNQVMLNHFGAYLDDYLNMDRLTGRWRKLQYLINPVALLKRLGWIGAQNKTRQL